MAGYNDTKQKILDTLMQRPVGTEIQPDNHQDFALSLLDYCRSVELISASTLIGIAYTDTVPVQSNDASAAYIAGVAQAQTAVFTNFIDEDGNAIMVTTGDMEGKIVILVWNRQYWDAVELPTSIISSAENADFFYSLFVRKTYSSKAQMEADTNPVGDDGKPIKVGEIVSVFNETDDSYNGLYSRTETGWQYQGKFSNFGDNIDGGTAFTKYGGVNRIDGGNAYGN